MQEIDRKTIVSRNDIIYTQPELSAPVSVGNGKFAFTVDRTGLQTFPEIYNQGLVLGTMADYGWHYQPNPKKYKIEDVYKAFDSHGRKVLYPYDNPIGSVDDPGSITEWPRVWLSDAAKWLYENPSRMGLGRIGLIMTKADGSSPSMSDLHNLNQHLELWTGCLISSFEIEGQPVTVRTNVHPSLDMVAIRVESPLIKLNRLRIGVWFPYANNSWAGAPEDWDHPEKHTTEVFFESATRVDFSRKLDNEDYTSDDYLCTVTFPEGVTYQEEAKHEYAFSSASNADNIELSVTFAASSIPDKLPGYEEAHEATVDYWRSYWSEGAFIDLSGSKDPRWRDLEKRIILSQYVTAVNCASLLPPQECGLVQKSWHGKFHMEMPWWHVAHFAFWDRLPLMMRSMQYYKDLLPSARERARFQGYKGARYPKMAGPDGQEAPNSINPFLVWQQPHPIYFAELCYREKPTEETLEWWWEVVHEAADFMATFVVMNEETGIYDIGPPLNDVHEDSEIGGTRNTPYEVAYFRWTLNVARKWRERMGEEPHPLWDDVVKNLAPLEISEGRYQVPGIQFGTLPLPNDIDREVLDRTVEYWVKNLPERSCSWGYPVTAMAAARAGHPDLAVEALLFPSVCNTVSSAGYNYWNERVPVYLPGNGALLSAVAMMAGGWDGAPKRNAPGFPENGQWVVKSEGLQPMP